MPFNYAAQRLRADRMITRYGTATATLRRSGVDRPCTAVQIGYFPQFRRKLVNPVDRQVLLSALAPDGSVLVPPDKQLDQLVMIDAATGSPKVLRIIEPPAELAPADVVVFWDLTVRG